MLKFMTFFTMLATTLIGCEQSSFEGAAPSLPVQPVPVVPIEPEPQLLTEFFDARPEPQDKPKVDVLFLMDTSGSMIEEKDAVETKLQEFISKFDDSLDYHIYVVGSEIGYVGIFPDYIPFDINLGDLTDSERVTKIDEPVDSFNALQVFYNLISEEDSPLVLRQDATLEVVVISDDNPITLEETNFRLDHPALLEYKQLFLDDIIQFPLQSAELIRLLDENFSEKQIHFNGFIGNENSVNTATCVVQNIGQDYIDLSIHEKYTGFTADICSDDWNSKFDDLAFTIIDQNSAQKYALQQVPSKEIKLNLYINDVLIDEENYTISENEIVFNQSLEPTEGDSIKIIYLGL